MSKLATEIVDFAVGVTLIVLGAFFGPAFILAGVSFIAAGLALVFTPGPITGIAASTRNAIKEWDQIYGRTKIGGTIVGMFSFGSDSKFLDLIILVASHPCKSVDALCFDNQRVLLDENGISFTPDNNSVNLVSIIRTGDVVEYITDSPMDIQSGDYILIHDVSGDLTLNGKYIVETINSTTFRYVCGGAPATVLSSGFAKPQFPDYGKKVYMETLLGNHSATFNGELFGTPYDGDFGNNVINESQPWTADCLNLGKTSVMLRIHYNDTIFAGGLPQISFRVSGKNNIFDPRDGTVKYTENAALCIADYLSNTIYGFKATYGTEIPNDALITSANTCEEAVDIVAGGTEPRYTCNGTFDLSQKRSEVLSNMLTCCAGRLTFTGGQFKIHPGVWVAPDPGSTLTLAQSSGPFEWKGPSLTTLFNGCKGRYVSPQNNWIEGDFPAYAQDGDHGYDGPAEFQHDANLAADGGDRRWLEIALPFTISSSAAQRIAKIYLLRSRFGSSGTFAFNLALYRLSALDTVKFNLPLFGWTNKLLEITSHRFAMQKGENDVPVLGTELTLTETDPSVYDWSTTEELVPQGFRIGNAFPLATDFFNTLGAIRPAGAAQVFLDASIFNYATMASGGSSTVFLDSNFDGLSGFGSTTAAFAGTIAASGTTAGAGTASFASPVLTSLSSAGVGTGTLAAIILASVEGDGAASVATTGTRL